MKVGGPEGDEQRPPPGCCLSLLLCPGEVRLGAHTAGQMLGAPKEVSAHSRQVWSAVGARASISILAPEQ